MTMENSDRVGRALRLLQSALTSFISRQFGEQEAEGHFADMDVAALLSFMDRYWNEAFRQIIGRTERSLVNELRDIRNDWAHQKPFSNDDAFRALDSTYRLLVAVDAPEAETGEAKKMREEVLRELAGERATTGRAPRHDGVKCIAVDWSGAKDIGGQRKNIWLGEAVNCELLRLEGGRTRNEVVDILVKAIQSQENLVIGLDFAFSFPQWYLEWRKLSSVCELWELAGEEGGDWIQNMTCPFWDGQKSMKPEGFSRDTSLEYRETEREIADLKLPDAKPESVFKLVGHKQVGRGSILGQPFLLLLQDAGAAIWPFDIPKIPVVIEIYPRLLTGKVKKTDRGARIDYLTREYPDLNLSNSPAREMVESDDAFDAGVSALVMSAHADGFARLERATKPPKSLEGEIWSPS